MPMNRYSAHGLRPMSFCRAGINTSGRAKNPPGWKPLTLTFYREHIEHRVIARIASALLAEHQVHLHIQEIDYDQWHAGDISDIWLNSANFTLTAGFLAVRAPVQYRSCRTAFTHATGGATPRRSGALAG